jgi:hypothetical protein
MSNVSYLSNRLAALPMDQRTAVIAAFEYVLATLKLGRAIPGAPLPIRQGNVQMYPLTATTPATPDTEFLVPHGLPFTPYLLVPCVPLDQTDATLAPLTVTRPADSRNVYLSSSVANATVFFFVEG